MNTKILEKYGLEMKKTSSPFTPYIKGNIEAYLYIFRDADNVQDFINDIELAINGNYDLIEDYDWSAELGTHWNAVITPTSFELWQNSANKLVYPLEDWKQILLSWKECLK